MAARNRKYVQSAGNDERLPSTQTFSQALTFDFQWQIAQ
jgi:hypothetical protein